MLLRVVDPILAVAIAPDPPPPLCLYCLSSLADSSLRGICSPHPDNKDVGAPSFRGFVKGWESVWRVERGRPTPATSTPAPVML
jgi:hypothetical protein